MELFATADLQLIPDFTLVVLGKNGKTNRCPHDLVNIPEEPAAML